MEYVFFVYLNEGFFRSLVYFLILKTIYNRHIFRNVAVIYIGSKQNLI